MTEPLTVASFNIRNGRAFDGWNSWPFRRRATAATIGALDADLIGLQEVYRFQLRYLLGRLPEYTAVGDSRTRRGERTPVLSRHGVVGHATRWFEVTGGRFPRIATTAIVQVRGQRVGFTSLHLDEASDARRRASVDQLIRWLADSEVPQIVVGDFNAALDDQMFQALRDAGFRSALDPGAGGTAHHFRGRGGGRQIDHVLVPADAEVLEAKVIRATGRLPSDHWPVVTHVRLIHGIRPSS